jgi:tRNA pseudouridine38-40 synthase
VGRRNFLLTLAYDGTDFLGWQRLPGAGRSVQGTVEDCLSALLGERIEIVGAGRTDAGVHAEGQAASFHSRSALGCEAIAAALDAALPEDLSCRSCREVDPRFHARFRAKSKLYRYRLYTGEEPDAATRRTSLQVRGGLDVDAMRAAGAELPGERNFRAFTNAKGGDTVRRLDSVRVEVSGDFVDLYFSAKGFLYNQARIMAALLLEAGRGGIGPADIRTMLESGDRRRAPGALGAFGLCLMEVRY